MIIEFTGSLVPCLCLCTTYLGKLSVVNIRTRSSCHNLLNIGNTAGNIVSYSFGWWLIVPTKVFLLDERRAVAGELHCDRPSGSLPHSHYEVWTAVRLLAQSLPTSF